MVQQREGWPACYGVGATSRKLSETVIEYCPESIYIGIGQAILSEKRYYGRRELLEQL
jgi:hypothetical protein